MAAISPDISVPTQMADATRCAVLVGLFNACNHVHQKLIKGISASLERVIWCDSILFLTVESIPNEHGAGNERPAYLWSELAALLVH